MARGQAKYKIKNKGRQPPLLENQDGVLENQHCVFELTVCKKAESRHQEASNRSQKRTFADNRKHSQTIHIQKQSYPENTDTFFALNKQRSHRQESKFFSCLSCCRNAELIETSKYSHILYSIFESPGKRKREQDVGYRSSQTSNQPPSKRSRTSPSSCIVEEELRQGATSDTNENNSDHIRYWVLIGRWRKEYFEQDSQIRDDFERGKSPEELEQKD